MTRTGAFFMGLVLLWSGLLAAGFTWAAVSPAEDMSSARRTAFVLIGAFLALLAVRTGYELVRRLVLSRRD